ncbi:MAG TPA: GNAT family N-acetyltransferase [Bryobacteraceae bacterium]|nr:GNAT family N-acetyltransferase [Bryobacteraceae bacterium]
MLSDWVLADSSAFAAIAADPEVIRYIGDGTPWSAARSREFIERQIGLCATRGFCLWKLTPKQGGDVIGFCGLQPLPETDDIEIGWWLARAWWGRGLATEAARAAVDDGFTRAALTRMVAIAQPANTASIRIMEKLGMRFERMTQSRGTDVVMYAINAIAGGSSRHQI